MLTFREQLETSYERSSGGVATPTSNNSPQTATPSNRGSSPSGMQGQRLIPSTPSTSISGGYSPDSGTPSTTPSSQLSNGSNARPSLAQPRAGDMVLGGNSPPPRPGAGDMVLGGQGTSSSGNAAAPNTSNGGNARPTVGNGTNPNYQPSGISGGGSNNVLRGAANALNRFAKLPSLLQVPLELLAPDSAGESEGEYLKKNAGKLKPDPRLNGEKMSPKFKGGKYPQLGNPQKSEPFTGGQENSLWNQKATVTYAGDDAPPGQTFDLGNFRGKVVSVSTNTEGDLKTLRITVNNNGAINVISNPGFGHFSQKRQKNVPAASVSPIFSRLEGSPKPEDTQPQTFPETQPNPDFAPNANTDPTLSPTNQSNPQNAPTKQPQIQPGQPTDQPKTPPKDKDGNPLEPFTPLIPFLPTIPSLFPPSNPPSAPNNAPTPTTLNPTPTTPGQGPQTAPTTKTPPTTNKPGEFQKTNTELEKKTFTPNADPSESGKCCPSQGEDLKAIKRILGIDQFPATLPLLSGSQTRIINNIPDLLLWNSSNVDSVAGYFPAKVTVVQGDSSEKSFELKNIGHAFEELFGALLLVAQDADASVNIGARTATEVVQTKIAVQQGNQLLTAIQKFLGFTIKPIARTLKINFSPNADGIDNKLANAEMANFLKPSVTNYVGSELAEKKEVLPIIERILNNSEICKMAVWQPLKPDKAGKDTITGSRIADKKGRPSPQEVKQWEAYIKILKDAGFVVEDKSPKKDAK